MTPEQLAEIEQRWARWIDPKSAPKTLGGDFLILLAEVRRLIERLQYEETCHAEAVQEVKRLNRMVDCSIWWHENCSDCDVCHRKLDCSLLGCGNAWRKYLESEVADND